MGDVRQAAFELADAAATFGAAALKLAALDIRCDTTLPNESDYKLGVARRVGRAITATPALVTVSNLDTASVWMEVKGSEPLVVNTGFTLPSASTTGAGGGGPIGQV
ncbi:hypothetical protein WJX77_006431 [Trebouxia sp. C0004]